MKHIIYINVLTQVNANVTEINLKRKQTADNFFKLRRFPFRDKVL